MNKDMVYSLARGVVKAGAGALVAHGVIKPEAVTANGIEIWTGIIIWSGAQIISWIHQASIKGNAAACGSRGWSVLLMVVMGLGLAGCVSVPANKISLSGPTGKYEISTPKNVAIEDFNATVATNGEVSVKFKKWTSTNDPNVISKSAAGQAAIIDAYGKIVTNSIAVGIEQAKKMQ